MNIDPEQETKKITEFIQSVLKKTRINKIVIGLSGGIDSTASFYLLKKSMPVENIFVSHLYYSEPLNLKNILQNIPPQNILNISMKPIVDICVSQLGIGVNQNKIRTGNITARIRMIILYDLAKKHNALVCGTENKSEHYLGYFTRFGDEASDFETIMHLYKTQVCKLAEYLKVPGEILNAEPTAGLWEGQTDQKELGFSYDEADEVLKLYFEQKKSIEEILKMGFKNAEKIIKRVKENEFKHQTPYSIK